MLAQTERLKWAAAAVVVAVVVVEAVDQHQNEIEEPAVAVVIVQQMKTEGHLDWLADLAKEMQPWAQGGEKLWMMKMKKRRRRTGQVGDPLMHWRTFSSAKAAEGNSPPPGTALIPSEALKAFETENLVTLMHWSLALSNPAFDLESAVAAF